ncbi:serine hydrolase domain-containing protein [Schlesneria sp. T3-172]|uniref:serine hydrolase domain-containing protein n=1 Tax=Schlesneria sphaerica TaxID=3373610 RepID=UPI0037C86743
MWIQRLHCRFAPAFLLAVVCGNQLTASAAEFDLEKLKRLDAVMQKYVEDKTVAGLTAAIGSREGIVATSALGYLNREQKLKMPVDALFRIASMTKPITAIGIMMLVDDGKLSVDDPVEKHLPEFRGQLLIETAGKDQLALKKPSRPIVIRDLLTHTSGLPGGFPSGISDLYFRRQLTLGEATAISSQRPLDFEPGTKWAYCNAGIDVLGRIVEVVSGVSFETFLENRLFQPLGMRDTTFYPSDEQLQRLAALYDMKNGELSHAGYQLVGPSRNARHPIPAGGLFSTAQDLGKLYRMMLTRGAIGELRLLSEQSVAAMTSNQVGDLPAGFTSGVGMGFGWQVIRRPEGVHEMMSAGTYGHGGAFGTQAWIDPVKDVFVILLIQRSGLPNADASEMRAELQTVAVEALAK